MPPEEIFALLAGQLGTAFAQARQEQAARDLRQQDFQQRLFLTQLGQQFQAEQGELERLFRSEEAETQREFTAEQSRLGRQFRREESRLAREERRTERRARTERGQRETLTRDVRTLQNERTATLSELRAVQAQIANTPGRNIELENQAQQLRSRLTRLSGSISSLIQGIQRRQGIQNTRRSGINFGN